MSELQREAHWWGVAWWSVTCCIPGMMPLTCVRVNVIMSAKRIIKFHRLLLGNNLLVTQPNLISALNNQSWDKPVREYQDQDQGYFL